MEIKEEALPKISLRIIRIKKHYGEQNTPGQKIIGKTGRIYDQIYIFTSYTKNKTSGQKKSYKIGKVLKIQ